MEQLVEAYHNVAASPEFREMVRQRERARHNEASALANAELKARREIVKNMYKEGFDVADIIKATKFSEKDVKDILGLM
jgi:DNA-binding NarL/FixJ family response regulator